MTDTPKDGDLGRTMGGEPCRWRDGKWRYGQGLYIVSRPADVTPTGERAIPIEWHDDVKAVAATIRAHVEAGVHPPFDKMECWANMLDPPTPKDDA